MNKLMEIKDNNKKEKKISNFAITRLSIPPLTCDITVVTATVGEVALRDRYSPTVQVNYILKNVMLWLFRKE